MENPNLSEKIFDVIIIGGGPAGYAAALYCCRAGLKTLIAEQDAVGGQMSTTNQIDNYPGFEDSVDGYQLAVKMKAGAERFGAETLHAKVTSIKPSDVPKKVETTSGVLQCTAIILAMGASPRKLGLPGENELIGKGISYCAACDGMFFKDKTAVVVGGGNSAAIEALTLSKLCKKVYIIHHHDSFTADKASVEFLEAAPNIEPIFNGKTEQLIYDSVLRGIAYSRTDSSGREKREKLDCQGLFVAIGRIPNTALAAVFLNLDSHGYIIADESTNTNVPGVFAVGDLRTKPLRQIITAAADGATASKFAAEYVRQMSRQQS